jgi:hypothetical protein
VSHLRSVCRAAALLGLATSAVSVLDGGSPALAARPSCQRGQYDVLVGGWRSTGGVLVGVGIGTAGIQQCTLKTTVHFVLRYSDGKIIRSIRGNPASWVIDTELVPWDVLARGFLWSNWCNRRRPAATATVRVGPTVRTYRAGDTPTCRSPRARSRLIVTAPPRGDRIPAHILPPEAPIPISPSFISVTNAWLVSDGRTLAAVYAGEAGNDPTVGRFAVVRQNLLFGLQTCWAVDVGRTGKVTITKALEGTTVERSAQRGRIEYASAGGETGVLDLARTQMTMHC